MPLPVARNIRVYTLDPDYITVEWEVEPTTLDLAQYAVEVWRAESEGGEYARVSMTMIASDVFDFQDRSVNMLSKWRHFYYRVRLLNRADLSDYQDFGSNAWRKVLEGEDPGGICLGAPPDLFALESIRRFNLVMREFGGRRVLVSVERTWGQRCPVCWDALKRRRNGSNCLTCFDTGLLGGFWRPIEAWSMMPPHQVMQQLTPLFELQVDDRILWFSRYPRLKPRDVVTSVDGDRYRVIKLDLSEKAWSLTRQTAQVRRLSRDQVEYRLPIEVADWGRNNLTVGAMREHVRATNLDSYYEAVSAKGMAAEELFQDTGDFATHTEDSDAPHD